VGVTNIAHRGGRNAAHNQKMSAQRLLDYAPKAEVLVRFPNGRVARLTAEESLPAAFRTFG
jgi:hypothetical protein